MAGDGREGGYIKLHRRLKSWPLWKAMSALQRQVWIELLMSANWRDEEAWFGERRYTVKRGQLSHSEATIAREAKVGRQVVRDTFDRLTAEGSVTRAPALPGTQVPWITTLVNYERFQGSDEDENPQQNQPRTTGEPPENQARTPREEREEGKKGRIIPKTREALVGPGHPAFEAIEHWLKVVWPRLSTAKPAPVNEEQGRELAALTVRLGTVELRARMDRAAADEWWREKLTLDRFIANVETWAERKAGATGKGKVTAEASDRSAFGKGEVAL